MRKKNYPKPDTEQNQSLTYPELAERAFNKSLKYLSIRGRSTKEIKDYLLRKSFSPVTVDAVIKKLNELKFLNDEEFAKAWIRSKQFKGKSKFIIKNELRLKGINRGMIDHTLKEAREDFEIARELFEKQKKRLSKLDPTEFRKKMGAFLQRRGFSFEIINKILKG